MSFSARIKEELSRQMSPARHCQIAEIAAILSLCGGIQISGDDRYTIKIHTENVTVARKCFTLLKKTFNIEADISIRRNAHLGKNRVYSVCVKQHEDALRVLKATKLLSEDGEIGENLSVVGNVVVQNPCCRRAFLRGAFLASGSISDPEKFYHFEIVCATEPKARQIQSLAVSCLSVFCILPRFKQNCSRLVGTRSGPRKGSSSRVTPRGVIYQRCCTWRMSSSGFSDSTRTTMTKLFCPGLAASS